MHRIRIFTAFLVIMFLSTFVGQASAKGKKKTLDGYLVDISCVNDRSNELATLGIVHTKQCLQMGPCSRSGYALLTRDRKVIKFDAAGNQEASKLIAAADQKNDFRIKVSGRLDGDEMAVSQLTLLPQE
jgi:hypothetical protein